MLQPRPIARASALAATQHGLVTADQCVTLGVSRHAVHRRVRSGAWTREGPGVYHMTGAPRTWHSRVLAAVMAAGPEALASHRTAAHLWGLEGFGPPGRVEVTVRRHRRPAPQPGVIVHESLAYDLAAPGRRWGIPVTGAARVLVDLAAVERDENVLLRALDEIRRLGLASWLDLWETFVLHARRGRPGIVRCRTVLERRHGQRAPDGEFARLFLRLLDDAGLPAPVCEYWVTTRRNRYRVDAAYPPAILAIELDGKGTHMTDVAFEQDRIRDNELRLVGWTVLRYTWDRFVNSPNEIVAELRLALAT